MNSDIFSTITGSVSQYGVIHTMIIAIISTILATILIVCGILLIRRKHNKTSLVEGVITSAICDKYSIAHETGYECQLSVVYVVNGKKYNATINTKEPIEYVAKSSISLEYNPNDPTDVEIKSIGSKNLAIILIVIAVIMLLSSWGYYFLVKKYPGFALFTGAEDIVRAF